MHFTFKLWNTKGKEKFLKAKEKIFYLESSKDKNYTVLFVSHASKKSLE
jgi:hypothetical protein